MTGGATHPQGSIFPHAPGSPKKLLCLYAQEDARFFRELQSHLYVWVRSQKIVWLEIGAGDLIGEAMERHLRQADLILLLDSADFIRDDAQYQWMQIALAEQIQRQVPVIPILARPSEREEAPYGMLKALPENQQPISLWTHRDEAYAQMFKSLALLPLFQSSQKKTIPATVALTTEKQNVSAFQARSLTSEYVARPEIVARLKQSLLQSDSVQTTAITTALQGAGGFGKTTLALALSHDPEVRAAFPDGIFWIELGEQPPGELDLFNRLLPALGDTATEAGTLNEARERWQRILEKKTCLLILDDVWQASVLEPLLQGGPHCRRLVTTRYDAVLPQSAQRVIVDAMSEQEALTMLTQGLSINLKQPSIHSLLIELVEHLGYWPLLLSMAHGLLATRLRYGSSFAQALEEIRQTYQGKRGISLQQSHQTGFQETVEVSIQASFRQLQAVVSSRYQPVERYQELAIFPEDTDIPIPALRLFWQTTGRLQAWETDDLCMQLAGLELLVNCDLDAGTIRLHDVTRQSLIDHSHSSLTKWQRQFVDAIQQGLGIQRWAEVAPVNAYLWQHLIWHLCQAERWNELQTTLTDLGFLARKALYQGVSVLETNLLLTSQISSQRTPETLSSIFLALHRRVARLSHLLRQAQNPAEMGSLFLSHLGTDEPFAIQRSLLERELPRPYLIAWHPLPERASSSLIRTLHGHSSSVRACAFSPDGHSILSASDDGTLKLWDAADGRELRTLSGHSHTVNACVFSPDGHAILSSSYDHTLKLWDATSGRELLTLFGHSHRINACAFSPDGHSILSASDDRTLKLWDAASGRELRTLSGHSNTVNACAFSPDGQTILSASNDRTLKLWDAASGRELRTLSGHSHWVTACAFSPDGQTILSAYYDCTLKLWDASSGRELCTLSGHSHRVNTCTFSPDGKTILSASYDKTLKLWDAASGRELLTLSGHSHRVNACAFSPDGHSILSASYDHTLKLWDASSGRELRTLSGHSNWVAACAFSPDGKTILSASDDHTLKLWDASSGRELRTLSGHSNTVNACVFSPDGKTILSASYDHTLKLWDASSGRELRTLSGHFSFVNACAFSPDGHAILSASADNTLKLWDASSGRELLTLSDHSHRVNACAFSPDGKTILSASYDHTLKLWDASSGRELLTLSGHSSWVTACAFSPDGKTILSASYDHTLKLWDASSGRELLTLSGHSFDVTACAFNFDGKTILSASNDCTLKLWHTQSGQCLLTFPVDGALSGCAFHPDGEHLVVCGDHGIFFLRLIR